MKKLLLKILLFFLVTISALGAGSSSVIIFSPNGGESVKGVYYITWGTSLDVSTVKLDYSVDNGSTWKEIATDLNASYGYYPWDTSASTTDGTDGQIKVRITALKDQNGSDITGITDESDAGFTLNNFKPILLNPNSSSTNITWANDTTVSFLVENGEKVNNGDIEIQLNGIDKIESVTGGKTANPKLFSYTLDTRGATGNVVSGNGNYTLKILVKNHGNSERAVSSQSNAIDVENIYITSPIDSTTWSGTQNITWTGAETNANSYETQYSADGGTTWNSLGTGSTDNTMSINSNKILQLPANQAVGDKNVKIKLIAKNSSGFYAWTESELFKVSHRPVVNEVYAISTSSSAITQDSTISGHTAKIKWTATDPDLDTLKVNISYSVDGESYVLLAPGETNDGEYTFDSNNIPESTNVKIKVEATDNGADPNNGGPYVSSLESGTFEVKHTPTVSGVYAISTSSSAITQDSTISGHTAKIKWTATDPDGDTLKVNISYSVDGESYVLLAPGETNDGEYTFDSNNIPESTNVKIKVEATDNGAVPNNGGPYVSSSETTQFTTKHTPVITTWDIKNAGSSIKLGNSAKDWANKDSVFSWNVTDPDNDTFNVKLEYSQNSDFSNSTVIVTTSSAIGNYTWDSTSLTDGEYYVKLTATDNSANNYTISETSGKIVIDNADKPTVVVEQPIELNLTKDSNYGYKSDDIVWGKSGDKVTSKKVTFKITNNDIRSYNIGDVSYKIYYIKDSATPVLIEGTMTNTQLVAKDSEITETYDWDISALTDGNYKIKIEATTNNTALKNSSDNINSAENSNEFTILNHYPKFNKLTGLDKKIDLLQLGRIMKISWNSSDPDVIDTLKYHILYKKNSVSAWPLLTDTTSTEEKGIIIKNYNLSGYNWDTLGTSLTPDVYYDIRIISEDSNGNKRYLTKEKAIIVRQKPQVTLLSPAEGDSLSGSSEKISWYIVDPNNVSINKLKISLLDSTGTVISDLLDLSNSTDVTAQNGQFNFDTQGFNEGSYKIKVYAENSGGHNSEATSETGEYGYTESSYLKSFTIKHKPTIEVSSPVSGEVLSGTKNILWSAKDPDGDTLTLSIAYSLDSSTWNVLNSSISNNGSFSLNTKLIPESNNVSLKFIVSDGKTNYDGASELIVNNLKSIHKPSITILSPQESIVYKNQIKVSWNSYDPDGDSLTTKLSYIDDLGEHEIAGFVNGSNLSEDVLKSINTSTGEFKLKVTVNDGTSDVIKEINVTLDRNPEIFMISPVSQDIIKNIMTIKWKADNPNGDNNNVNEDMKISLLYSVNGGSNWLKLYEDLTQSKDLKKAGTDEYSYTFDTKLDNPVDKIQKHYEKGLKGIPDSKNVKIKIIVTDKNNDKFTATAETDLFTIANYIPIVRIADKPKENIIWYGKRDIRWEATSNTGIIEEDKNLNIKLYYSLYDKDNTVKTWKEITKKSTFNDGIYTWDTNTVADGKYYIKVEAQNRSGIGEDEFIIPVEINNSGIDLETKQFYNYPNPFKSSTTFKYRLPNDMKSVKIDLYSSQGQKIEMIEDLPNEAGVYRVPWIASGYSNGVYFARLVAIGYDGKEYIKIDKIALLK
ncbi:hypothetical protein [Haliovirga abyssi]|uniref:Uncharacterized protein n=1 Tax=Haliovirga abyssi TaxID=2996794 RepID=A0AAU9D7F2_9FUSO|nr:hypothetical protein [Haliovirga abyssi]BDU50508.1 hypothetical protein HLVA_10770 [Haliovirga abyssi]